MSACAHVLMSGLAVLSADKSTPFSYKSVKSTNKAMLRWRR